MGKQLLGEAYNFYVTHFNFMTYQGSQVPTAHILMTRGLGKCILKLARFLYMENKQNSYITVDELQLINAGLVKAFGSSNN